MIELFTPGDLVIEKPHFRPTWANGYHYLIDIRGKSIYYFEREFETTWDSYDDNITHPKYIDLYTDIFRQIKE